MGSQPGPPIGIIPLPETVVRALREAAAAQQTAILAHEDFVLKKGILDRELMPVVLEVISTGGEYGVTLSQIADVVEQRMGVDAYDIFPICRELFRLGLVSYAKEPRPNRAGNTQVQSVQYITERGKKILTGELPWGEE